MLALLEVDQYVPPASKENLHQTLKLKDRSSDLVQCVAVHQILDTADDAQFLQPVNEFRPFGLPSVGDRVSHQCVYQMQSIRAQGMVSRSQLVYEAVEKVGVDLQKRYQSLESKFIFRRLL